MVNWSFSKVARQLNEEKDIFFSQWFWISTSKKLTSTFTSYHTQKLNCKWIIDLNVVAKTIKSLKKILGQVLILSLYIYTISQ